MNYFFKYLIPQLLNYFNNDKEELREFIPEILFKIYDKKINEVLVKGDEVVHETLD